VCVTGRPFERREELHVRLDGPAKLRHVVAELLAEPAGLKKIALHVDDQQGQYYVREGEFLYAHSVALCAEFAC
jgi:hypothetical protein